MTVFTNLALAAKHLDEIAPMVVDHHRQVAPIARADGGDLLFRVIAEDTSEDGVREDGVSWSTGGTRSWEIVQHVAGRGWCHVVAGYYCHDRGGIGI